MKNIYISVLFFALSLLTVGCAREEALASRVQGDVVIRVALDGLTTKATMPGEGAENTVNSLDVIIFNSEGTDQLYKWHIEDPTLSGDYYEQTTLGNTLTNLGSNPAATLQSAKTLAIANYPGDGSSFASKTLAQVQAMAVDAANSTTDPARSKFVYPLDDGTFRTLAPPSFVMTTQMGSFSKTGDTMVSTISLKRLAAKVSLTLTYPSDPITTTGEYAGKVTQTIWVPMSGENTRIYLDNAASTATLGGAAGTPATFRYADNTPAIDPSIEDAFTSGAFYTYPLTWTAGSDHAPFIKIIQPWYYVTSYNEGTEASPKPVIVDENVVELYYKVLFPGLTELESNTWYKPTVELTVLGGEADEPVELSANGLEILDWGSASGISSIDIQPAKYLVPETHALTVENGNAAIIRYMSSGPITVSVESIYKYVYTNSSEEIKYIYSTSDTWPSAGVVDNYVPIGSSGEWFSNNYDSSTHKGTITLNHQLSSNFDDSNFTARPYTYLLKLQLVGGGADDQLLTITQYPPLTVEGSMSTGWVCINGVDANKGSSEISWFTKPSAAPFYTEYKPRTTTYTKPYVLLPKWQTGTGNNPRLIYMKWYNNIAPGYAAQVNNLGSVATYDYLNPAPASKNACRWRVIIRPAVKEGRYLMDPRIDLVSESSDNLYKLINQYSGNIANSNIVSNGGSPLLDGTSSADIEQVKKYRPTRKKDWISANSPDPLPGVAPEFMVASSYGKSVALNYFSAVLRCAAYQEDGYPAGRWRLPTEEEIDIAIRLFESGAIPNLFDGTYWTSSGRYRNGTTWTQATDPVMSAQTNTGTMGARCVYDTWYWGSEEVAALKTSDFGSDYTKPQYVWSGYNYTSK